MDNGVFKPPHIEVDHMQGVRAEGVLEKEGVWGGQEN